jgi:hypothetical protein
MTDPIDTLVTQVATSEPIAGVLIALVLFVLVYLLAQRGSNRNSENLTNTLRDVLHETSKTANRQLEVIEALRKSIEGTQVVTVEGLGVIKETIEDSTASTKTIAEQSVALGVAETSKIVTAQSDRVIGELHTAIDSVITNIDKVWHEVVAVHNVATHLRDKIELLAPPAIPVSPVIKQPTE